MELRFGWVLASIAAEVVQVTAGEVFPRQARWVFSYDMVTDCCQASAKCLSQVRRRCVTNVLCYSSIIIIRQHCSKAQIRLVTSNVPDGVVTAIIMTFCPFGLEKHHTTPEADPVDHTSALERHQSGCGNLYYPVLSVTCCTTYHLFCQVMKPVQIVLRMEYPVRLL